MSRTRIGAALAVAALALAGTASADTTEMLPALEAEPGYAGALNVVDRESGNAMMLVLWETEAQARRALPEYGAAFLKALAAIAGISTGMRRPISVWEVNARA